MESSCLPPSNMQACSGDAQRDDIFTSCTTHVHEETRQNRMAKCSTAIVGKILYHKEGLEGLPLFQLIKQFL